MPHLYVVGLCVLSGTMTAVSTYLHYSTKVLDFSNLEGKEIDPRSKVTFLRISYDFWFSFLKIVITVILALSAAYIVNVFVLFKQAFPLDYQVAEAFAMTTAYAALFFIAFAYFGIMREIGARMRKYQEKILDVGGRS